MPTLASAQIIDAVAARLVGNTTAGTRVSTSRLHPWSTGELPAWRVLAIDEEIEAQTVHYPALLLHTLRVACVATARAVADIDDTLNALVYSALAALYDTLAHTNLGLSVQINHPARIEREFSGDGEAAIGQATLELRIQYRTAANAPGTIL